MALHFQRLQAVENGVFRELRLSERVLIKRRQGIRSARPWIARNQGVTPFPLTDLPFDAEWLLRQFPAGTGAAFDGCTLAGDR